MSHLSIIRYPDPRLNQVSKPVTIFDEQIKSLVKNMAKAMYEARGFGLAAPQIDVHKQLFIIDVSESRNELVVFINPEIVSASPEKAAFNEGCLSVPGVFEELERPARVKVRAQDVDGNFFEREGEGLFAVCVQHEVDHLNGFVFVDYLSRLKRDRIKTKMLKEMREAKQKAAKSSRKS
jgi:peptide deformylase